MPDRAVRRRQLHNRVENRRVRVHMDVDEPREDVPPGRVYHGHGAGAVQRPDRRDPAAGEPDIGTERRGAGAVGNHAALDHDIKHAASFPYRLMSVHRLPRPIR
jgi:hypothetical protein